MNKWFALVVLLIASMTWNALVWFLIPKVSDKGNDMFALTIASLGIIASTLRWMI